MGSSLMYGPAPNPMLADSCSYEVSKHKGDAGCAAYDVTIGMTVYVPNGSATETALKVGLVYTVTSLEQMGMMYTTDPSQLCTSGGYYTSTGDWMAIADSTALDSWPSAADVASLQVPAIQQIDVSNISIQNVLTYGQIDLSLSHK